MQRLDIDHLPLYGCQLIEASAGTGKTYSITRIYIRLLLQRQLDVREILVMTFTRAATEELRGRIASELRRARDEWATLVLEDDFYRHLASQLAGDIDAQGMLHRALLRLDEAPVFTIHSFCRQVLTRHAFATGVDFDTRMEQELDDLHLQAVRDWYRRLAENDQAYLCVSQYWGDPETFMATFSKVLGKPVDLQTTEPQQLLEQFLQQKQQCKAQLQQHQSSLFEYLVNGHKDEDKRRAEWQSLIDWLNMEDTIVMPAQGAAFLDGRRWARMAVKEEINAWMSAARQLKAETPKLQADIAKAQAYQWVKQGISEINQRIDQAKQAQRVMGFDDLVVLLAKALQTESGTQLAEMLAKEYPAALVDEFQDTDPQQYQILQQIYTRLDNPHTVLYLIGDPKQAIYAFRGGDVFAYLQARADTDEQWVMNTNWRSSRGMIAAYNRLFHGASLDQPEAGVFGPGIDYPLVKAAAQQDEYFLEDDTHESAMQMVHFPVKEEYADRSGCNKAGFREQIAHWCALEISRLLSGAVLFQERKLEAKDIVILVRDRTEADVIGAALDGVGIPSVYLSLRDKLFASEQAMELLQVLRGILELEDERLARAALVSPYLGGSPQQLQRMNEEEDFWEDQYGILLELRKLWLERGFVAMALTLFHQHYQPPQCSRERALTNSLHLMEVLQQASQRHRQPRELLSWFEEKINGEGESIEAELRLETDAALLRIQTQHGAKGLEYPVVFIPFATRYKDSLKIGNRNREILDYHDPDNLSAHTHLGWNEMASRQCMQEAQAESVRLLYVAVTRAMARCYLCSTRFSNYHASPLGLVLGLGSSDSLQSSLENLIADASDIGLRVIEDVDALSPSVISDSTMPTATLEAASYTAGLPQGWWLSSFSALTRNLRHGGLSLPDRDEADSGQQQPTKNELRFELPAGAMAGNLLHEIFEHLDFSEPDWETTCARPLARFGKLPSAYTTEDLIAWLTQVLQTPLQGELTLGHLTWHQTLRETAFYFPMRAGHVTALGTLLAKHRGQQGQVQFQVKRQLQGMMHGYIDLIFEWQGKFYIADYKSNYLGSQFAHYGMDDIRQSMEASLYDLQYLLYSLALHRYLRENLPDYQPQEHFGGVFYLYLRGMSTSSNTGVYHKKISPDTLEQLDRLFDEGGYV